MNDLWLDKRSKDFRIWNLSKPYDNFSVGAHPGLGMDMETAKKFDIFVNISETPDYNLDILKRPRPDVVCHWQIVPELEYWGYLPFHFTKVIMDDAYKRGKRLYLHCAGGTNRSPSLAIAWVMSLGHNLDQAAEIASPTSIRPDLDEHVKEVYSSWAEHFKINFLDNQKEGHIPSQLDEFYRRYKEESKDFETIVYTIRPTLEKRLREWFK